MNLQEYLQEITEIYQRQNATEHSYRPALKKLIESLDSGIQAINEPKRIACGAPDFVIMQSALELGHIEAKDISISLKKTEKTPQMLRYFNALGNLILTDYLEFRWYIQGELRLTASLATIDSKKQIKINTAGIQEVEHLLRQFLLTKVPQLTTPKDLAKRVEYEKGIKITEVMPINSVGIVTARDSLTIQWTEAEIEKIVNDFVNLDPEEARIKYDLGKDTRDWKVELAQKDLKVNFDVKGNKIKPLPKLLSSILSLFHHSGKN